MLVAAGLFVSVVGKAERRASACVRVRVRESQDESSLFASLSDCLALKTTVGGGMSWFIYCLWQNPTVCFFYIFTHSVCQWRLRIIRMSLHISWCVVHTLISISASWILKQSASALEHYSFWKIDLFMKQDLDITYSQPELPITVCHSHKKHSSAQEDQIILHQQVHPHRALIAASRSHTGITWKRQ